MLLFGVSGCAATYESRFAPASPPASSSSDAAKQATNGPSTAAVQSADTGAAAKEKKEEKPSEPPPRTIEEAICRYLSRLHADCRPSNSEQGKSAGSGFSPSDATVGGSPLLPIDSGKTPFHDDEDPAFLASFAASPVLAPASVSASPTAPSVPAADSIGNQRGAAPEAAAAQSDSGRVEQTALQEPSLSAATAPRTASTGLIEPSAGAPLNPESFGWLSAHVQTTVVSEIHDHFHSPYVGPNSLLPHEPQATSETSTIFLDTRIWEGGEVIFNPEVAGGTGFSGVTGIADFPNEEITRVGKPQPTPYVARLLFRQTWGLGGEQEMIEEGANQLGEKRDIDRVTLYIGKMAFTDIMDNNAYSHDARSQMLGWAMNFNGAWDFPADVRGYDYGLAIDVNHKWWAVRYGIFGEPDVANGPSIDDHVLKANGQALEVQRRWKLNDHPGAIRVMGYLNLAHMGSYRDAVAEMPVNPDVTATRAWRVKYGLCANLEQEITKDLGLWARLGWNDGHTETWAFTPIDDSLAFGFLLKGTDWHRSQDEVGLGFIIDGLSAPHREYLAAGGLDFNIGDGRLNYAPEEVLETYYNFQLVKGIEFTGDFQLVNNPAYNEDRGPVAIASFRVHFEY